MRGRPQDLVVLRPCIEHCLRTHRGQLPRDVMLIWEGYLAALLEQELLSEQEYLEARAILPKVADNPIDGIFLSWLDRWDESLPGG